MMNPIIGIVLTSATAICMLTLLALLVRALVENRARAAKGIERYDTSGSARPSAAARAKAAREPPRGIAPPPPRREPAPTMARSTSFPPVFASFSSLPSDMPPLPCTNPPSDMPPLPRPRV